MEIENLSCVTPFDTSLRLVIPSDAARAGDPVLVMYPQAREAYGVLRIPVTVRSENDASRFLGRELLLGLRIPREIYEREESSTPESQATVIFVSLADSVLSVTVP
jgi:hypothetical protein